jgi:hypothetical protein
MASSVLLRRTAFVAARHVWRYNPSSAYSLPFSQRYFSDKPAEQPKPDSGETTDHSHLDVTIEEELDANTLQLDRSKFTEEYKILMPALGNGAGKILEWFKKEGDVVLREDVLCDIETPDFTFGMENDDEHIAIMGKILVEAPSEPVKDNETICILLREKKEKKEEKPAKIDEVV